MRISDALAAAAMLLLAACHAQPRSTDTAVLAQVENHAQAQAADDGLVTCARGEAPLQRACTVDREEGPRGLILTIHHPDGGFRRLLVTRDGRGVVAADGAEPARVAIVDDGTIAVTVGDDHYRLPATVKGRS